MEHRPSISVIINTGECRDHAEILLASLVTQEIIEEMEIIILDSVAADVPPLRGHDHPAVTYIRVDPEILFPVVLVQGIRQARAPIVALLEEHCIAMPGWAAALVKAHQEPWGAVCGEVINGCPDVGISNAEFLACRSVQWQAPAERAELEMLDGHNSSYRRDLLLAYGDEALSEMLAAEATLLMKLKEDGHRLLLEPAARYAHRNEANIKTLPLSLFYWHRTFGDTRARVFRWGLQKRILRVGIALLTPPYQALKNVQYIRKKRPDLLQPFLTNLPMILFLGYASNIGQIAGLLLGKGRSIENFSDAERKLPRPLAIELAAQFTQQATAK
jgi:hypothetical protein